jgi:RNA polymerase sigma factor (sigma-70 family)
MKPSSYVNIHEDLIVKCMKGEKLAQFELYKIYYKAMFNTAMRITNHTHEAEDVVQESFLTVFEKMGEYKKEVSFGAWLKRIVINRSIDLLRERKISFSSLDEMDLEISDSIEDINNDDKLERIKRIKLALFALPEGYRVILSLYLLEGYDHEEISGILHISSSTSRSQLARAKQKLLELLKNK